MKEYKIVLKGGEGQEKSQIVKTLTFPEAVTIAYQRRAELRFEYEIESVSRVKK